MGEALERLDAANLPSLLHAGQQLAQVALETPLDCQHWRARGLDAARTGMKSRQRASHCGDLATSEFAAPEPLSNRVLLVVAAHFDHEVDRAGVVLRDEFGAFVLLRHASDAEVDVGRQAPVEAHLRQAHLSATGGSAVVEEVKDQGLFQLVRAFAGEEHPRDVRLADLHGSWPGRIGVGARQRVDEVHNHSLN
jgi:hypothetical protein